MATHKPYPAEFRAEAIRLVREHGMLPSQVASDLGMDRKTLQRWLDATATRLAPPAGGASSEELARLRREVDQLRMERDILKKPLGQYSRPCV